MNDKPTSGPISLNGQLSFSGFCAELGLPLRNARWSWCAINETAKQAVFTIWEDRLDRPDRASINFFRQFDSERTDNGAIEFRQVFKKALDQNYKTYGILSEAVDINAKTRKRKGFEQQRLLILKLLQEDGKSTAGITGTIDPAFVAGNISVISEMEMLRSAIDDLDEKQLGNGAPERLNYSGTFFARDDKVRQRVRMRAKGRCEYCNELGFKQSDGRHYVEAHHIISLSSQGPDTPENVIALCANHHREAHFGESRLQFEQDLLDRLSSLRTRK